MTDSYIVHLEGEIIIIGLRIDFDRRRGRL